MTTKDTKSESASRIRGLFRLSPRPNLGKIGPELASFYPARSPVLKSKPKTVPSKATADEIKKRKKAALVNATKKKRSRHT
jgi:hypothetical protein